jgi:SAM-dependent methyltransferase
VSGWQQFWADPLDGAHLEAEARYFARNLRLLRRFDGTERVLDFGCGAGYVAREIASHVGSVDLWDASPTARRQAAGELRHRNVRVLDDLDPESAIGDRYDLIIVNSVVQYMTERELRCWLYAWSRFLRPLGQVIVADVAFEPPNVPRELAEWVWFCARHGVLLPAVRFAWRSQAKYRAALAGEGLYVHERSAWDGLTVDAGLRLDLADANLTLRKRRATLVLSRPL